MIRPVSLVPIGSKYALGSDELCVTLYKRRVVKKTGRVDYDPIGYFPTFEQAFHRLADMHVQGCRDSCKFDCITELKKSITEAIRNLAQSPSLPDQAINANRCKGIAGPQKINGLERA